MNDLRVAIEIVLRSLAVIAAAEIAQRMLMRKARNVRRLWIATLFVVASVSLAAVIDWRPTLPRFVAAAPAKQIASPASIIETPRSYRRSPRRDVLVRGVYWIGVGGVALLVTYSLFALRRLRRSSTPASIAMLDVPPRCTIAFAAVDAPCTIGILRSTVLLPHASKQWPEGKLRAAMAHEFAHVRQRDTLWMMFAWASCAALWFAPAVWIARRRLRAACELASDAAAASAGGANAYAQSLIEIAESVARVPLAANMAGSVSLAHRIEWLLAPRRRALRAAALPVIVLTLAAFHWQTRITYTPSADPNVRAQELFRLARWQGRERQVLPILLASLGDDAPLRDVPHWSYDRDGWQPARATLVHASPGEVAAMGLASLSDIAARPLAERLRDRDVIVRRNAAWALGELRHPRGIGRREEAALIAALEDEDAIVRAAAAWSLGDIGTSEAKTPLEKMLARENDARARSEATAALMAVRQGVSSEYFRHKE